MCPGRTPADVNNENQFWALYLYFLLIAAGTGWQLANIALLLGA